ncbi:MAG: flagellar biosynthetic protein FliO [Gammaproteobacteria bacterium]|nr:flagellar biosynthetic protein FliO [Gammaproteobacteria bacterium]
MRNLNPQSIVLFVLCNLPLALFAETTVAKAPLNQVDAFSLVNLLNMVMGLAVVIALILGLAWVLRKYGRLPATNQVEMKILGGLSLGTRERAILIEVDNTRLLIGVAPGRVNMLHVLDGTGATPAAESFHQALGKELGDQL